jgi:sugar phosphate isomerase/epimerase
MGARLGAKVLSFWAGIDRQPDAGSRDRLLAGVRRTCALVRAEGLEPSFEPEPGMAVETVAAWRALAADLGSDAPGLTLDVGHLYAVWEGDPAAVIASVGPHLRQVHLEDMRRGEHEHLLPGAGDVDFDGTLNALRAAGYSGPVCFELSRSSHCAPTAVAACRELFRRLAGPAKR